MDTPTPKPADSKPAPSPFFKKETRGGAFQAQSQAKRKSRNQSEYKKSLTEKQTLKRAYGLSERQFKRYVTESLAKMGRVDDVSEELIAVLEKRLDNVVFRMGLAKTRTQSRQLVSHGFFSVNGKKVNIPSYQVKRDEVVSLRENKKKKGIFKELETDMKSREIPSWISVDKQKLEGKAIGQPTLQEAKPPAEISLIFEFYSR